LGRTHEITVANVVKMAAMIPHAFLLHTALDRLDERYRVSRCLSLHLLSIISRVHVLLVLR